MVQTPNTFSFVLFAFFNEDVAAKAVAGKKIPRWKHCTGSSPVPGTIHYSANNPRQNFIQLSQVTKYYLAYRFSDMEFRIFEELPKLNKV
jgi:hypothetical protein